MLYRGIGGFKRVLSLLLTVTLLLGCTVVHAGEMRVVLALSDASTILPLGTTVTVEVKGYGTAAVSLMIVKPDSTQEFRYGEVHQVTFAQPGMYVLVGYGANGTDEKEAGFVRCMSAFHVVTVVGEAPEELQGELSLEVFLNLKWKKLDGARVRRHQLPLLLRLDSQAMPEDSRLKLELLRGNQSVTVLEGSIWQDKQWHVDGEPAVRSLLSSQPYGQHMVQAVATLTAPDGQTLTTKADFSMGHYSPEMLYVNEFFDDNWAYAGSDMGKRLQKWLDMTPVEDGGDRTGSGYLMLEQEVLFRDQHKFGEGYIKWATKAMSVISSVGVELVFDYVSDEIAKKKFGDAGKDALPYYNMLGSVYNSYAQNLIARTQTLARGAYLMEEIQRSTKLVKAGDIAKKVYSGADLVKKAAELGKDDKKDTLLYIFSPANDSSTYYRMGRMDNPPANFLDITLTKAEILPLPDGSGTHMMVSWIDEAGKERKADVAYFAKLALDGDQITIDLSKVRQDGMTIQAFEKGMFSGSMKSVEGNASPIHEDVVETFVGTDGNRKIRVDGKELDFNNEIFENMGLMDILSPEDRQALDYYHYHVKADPLNAWEMGGLALDAVGVGVDIYQILSGIKYHSELQKAYFSTYVQLTDEYIHTLNNWEQEIKDSNIEDAELIQAAIGALRADIYATCAESLSKAQRQATVFTQNAQHFAETIYDAMELVCGIPQVAAGLKQLTVAAAKSTVNATKSAVNWIVKTVSSTGKAAAGAAASGAAAAGTATAAAGKAALNTAATTAGKAAAAIGKIAKTLSMSLLAFSVGSLISDLLMSAHIGYVDSIYTLYRLKEALKETIEETLADYGDYPTHQKALDIIESLYLMKELKIKGESTVTAWYLADMYKDAGLKGTKEQLILLNEIVNMQSTTALYGCDKIHKVYVVYQNHIAGERKELQNQGYKIEGIGGGKDIILDSWIVGIYRSGDEAVTFQGVELPKVPGEIKAELNSKSSREDAFTYGLKEPDWIKDSNSFAPYWQSNMYKSLSDSMFVKQMYVYSGAGLDLLLTNEEFDAYAAGEDNVNRILSENDDATGNELHFWEFKEKKEWQFDQRIVWTHVTRRYIESFPMFDEMEN